jgi:hypothetical protein
MILELLRHLAGQPDANVIQVGGIHPSSVPEPSAPRKTGYGEELRHLYGTFMVKPTCLDGPVSAHFTL